MHQAIRRKYFDIGRKEAGYITSSVKSWVHKEHFLKFRAKSIVFYKRSYLNKIFVTKGGKRLVVELTFAHFVILRSINQVCGLVDFY